MLSLKLVCERSVTLAWNAVLPVVVKGLLRKKEVKIPSEWHWANHLLCEKCLVLYVLAKHIVNIVRPRAHCFRSTRAYNSLVLKGKKIYIDRFQGDHYSIVLFCRAIGYLYEYMFLCIALHSVLCDLAGQVFSYKVTTFTRLWVHEGCFICPILQTPSPRKGNFESLMGRNACFSGYFLRQVTRMIIMTNSRVYCVTVRESATLEDGTAGLLQDFQYK